ncbi:metallophosphoesterase [Sporosarcina obsidiansis]|uniref:metallophosphoesterase n=1 Tax=Sporosarcina obsidiansis TaxID=2660748 RepID=UPI00129BE4E2|nr:metallophosphoesterase family protein [Sporosarcina obsidiansis]
MKSLLKALLSVLLSGMSVLTYMFYLAHQNRVLIHTLSIGTRTSKTLTIFFISDIHRRRLPKRLLKRLQKFPIDAVIVGGDVAEKGVPLMRVTQNIQQLASIGPLYYIFGNNDQEVGTEHVLKIIKDAGGVTLVDSTAPIPGHPSWGLCGLEDPSNGTVDIEKAIASSAWCEHIILAAHNPSLFRKIEGRMEPNVMLAGHTHGGQIRFGKWGLQDVGSFQKTANGAKLISNGYGTTMVPLRFGAKPECHVVEIHY